MFVLINQKIFNLKYCTSFSIDSYSIDHVTYFTVKVSTVDRSEKIIYHGKSIEEAKSICNKLTKLIEREEGLIWLDDEEEGDNQCSRK